MITGAHALMYSKSADELRAFFRDVLELKFVDAGHGWLIFALPPAELATHPAEGLDRCELYFMCDDLEQTMDALTKKGASFSRPITEERWGRLTAIALPGGGEMGLYQPKHPVAAGTR